MWQAKRPFRNSAEKERIVNEATLFDPAGIWEKDDELVLYFSTGRRLQAYLKASADPEALAGRVNDRIDWIARWKKFHKPVRVNPFLVVPLFLSRTTRLAPPFTAKIVIDPSFAFGTGSHPTTRMCLRYAAKLVSPGLRVLDMGTGSGILAIAAEKKGAAIIDAVDNDAVALREAEKNLRRNRCRRVALADRVDGRAKNRYDLCLCNILCNDILALKPFFDRVLAPGASLVLSGLLAEQRETVLAAYGDRYALVSSAAMRDRTFRWIALHLRKS